MTSFYSSPMNHIASESIPKIFVPTPKILFRFQNFVGSIFIGMSAILWDNFFADFSANHEILFYINLYVHKFKASKNDDVTMSHTKLYFENCPFFNFLRVWFKIANI